MASAQIVSGQEQLHHVKMSECVCMCIYLSPLRGHKLDVITLTYAPLFLAKMSHKQGQLVSPRSLRITLRQSPAAGVDLSTALLPRGGSALGPSPPCPLQPLPTARQAAAQPSCPSALLPGMRELQSAIKNPSGSLSRMAPVAATPRSFRQEQGTSLPKCRRRRMAWLHRVRRGGLQHFTSARSFSWEEGGSLSRAGACTRPTDQPREPLGSGEVFMT